MTQTADAMRRGPSEDPRKGADSWNVFGPERVQGRPTEFVRLTTPRIAWFNG